ncbi:hypothetical protein HPP92_004495 [Vanilla planifolia]|uniref:Uncharacterized protein n=1 Tax=Vanilla planifolia TaxID=51239 RepID=A0A835RWY7_VANPL|nr:hypothetical protein HPP92_004495 [Vanilla planifolia]
MRLLGVGLNFLSLNKSLQPETSQAFSFVGSNRGHDSCPLSLLLFPNHQNQLPLVIAIAEHRQPKAPCTGQSGQTLCLKLLQPRSIENNHLKGS